MSDIPVWDNASIYAGFSDPRYEADQGALKKTSTRLIKLLKTFPEGRARRETLAKLLELFDRADALAEQLNSFAYMVYSTDTRNEEAVVQMNRNEELLLPLREAEVRFRAAWASSGVTPAQLFKEFPHLKPYRLALADAKVLAAHQLSPKEEALAADLERAGADAWSRLQSSLSSTLTAPWDRGTKTVTELRQLAAHADRKVRAKAFELELGVWKANETAFAASLNGVKGHSVIMNRRRGWNGPLELSARQSRLSPRALETLLSVMEESLPVFRRYLLVKAKALKVPALAFYDLFAPVGRDSRRFTWAEAKSFLVKCFGAFSSELADFAAMAFEKQWIHAKPMEGKVGGAYCTSLPLAREPRVLSNFDGTFGEVKTLAHELGHAWHFWLLRKKPHVYHSYPMTLAETASTFAETLVTEAALSDAEPGAALFILEQSLQDCTQVVVDILSRFRFEKAVFERRETAELSAREFCDLMADAQKSTYGVLDETKLHPWMWAVKGHYYSAGLAFYNYPYAFGQLFALALYGLSRSQGPAFVGAYQDLLRDTGVRTANQLAERAGFDLEDAAFWRRGVGVIEDQVNQFERRVHGR